jgi:hypothetical protein
MAACGARNAKYALALGIDLEIIHRSLDGDFRLGRLLFPLAISRTTPVSKDGPNGLQIQWGTAAVDC